MVQHWPELHTISMWAVLLLVRFMSWTMAVHAGEENVVHLVSIGSDIDIHQFQYLDFHSNFLRRRAQIEQTTGHMLHVINQKRLRGLQVMPLGPIRYDRIHLPDWTYETYLSTSIRSIIARGMEFFHACHFKDNGCLQPSACLMHTPWKSFCGDVINDREAGALLKQFPDFPWSGNVTTDTLTVKSVMHSNCGEHALASTLATSLIETAPSNPYYRYLYSEILSRQEKGFPRDALSQINLAILLNASEPVFREKRISLLIQSGRATEAADDVRWLRQQMDLYLRDKYCSYCVRKRIRKPVGPIVWRSWLTLALYDFATHNTTQAERDLTVALDLAAAAIYANKLKVTDSVTSVLRHLKAIALHNNNKIQEAMDLAILNAHTDPSALDAVLLVAQTLARTSLHDRSLNMLNLALPLLDAFSLGPSSALLIQIFTEVSLLKRMFYQLRAWVYYRLGDIIESEENALTCLDLLPSDALCSYVLTLCKLVTGRFVDAVKAAAPVLSRWSDPKVSSSAEFIHLSYLKEWARYLHSRITRPMAQFHWLTDLPEQFKQSWVQSVPLESVPGYTEQPGINSELPDSTASPNRLKTLLLFSSNTDEFHGVRDFRPINFSTNCAMDILTTVTLDTGQCQATRLKPLGQFLCKLDAIFELFLPSSTVDSSPTIAPVNQRHRIAFALSALHSAESIRNFWCQRRRVSFSTCWSYNRNANDPWLLQRPPTFPDAVKDDRFSGFPGDQCIGPSSSSTAPPRRSCRSPAFDGPDWLVHTSAAARLVQLADPSGSPLFWHSTDRAASATGSASSPFGPPHRPTTSESPSHDCFEQSQTDTSSATPNNCENEWHTASVREQRYFIRHNQVVPDTLPYVPAAFKVLASVFRIRALLNPDSSGIGEESFSNPKIFEDLLSYFAPTDSTTSRARDDAAGGRTLGPLDTIVSYMDQLWREAGDHGFFDRHHRVALNLFVPGRLDLPRSTASESSNLRHLSAVLLFERDQQKNYMLSLLLLSNAQHRHDLSAELDAAFEEFLVHGEKALASILAGSSSQTGTRRSSASPFEDRYLQDAVTSAFHWLYYWAVLKPLESVYSFHVGFGLVLGMLRALGLEPKASVPVAERSLELEALFVGSPEAFATLCKALLNLSWLSSSSLALTWQVAPDELIQYPKLFIELLNLQAVTDCTRR